MRSVKYGVGQMNKAVSAVDVLENNRYLGIRMKGVPAFHQLKMDKASCLLAMVKYNNIIS